MIDVRVGYFVSFRGSAYGAFESKREAQLKAMDLISADGNGYTAYIYEGIVFIQNLRAAKGSDLTPIDVVTVDDCVSVKGYLYH
jgi:hypothetical protein